MDISEEDVYETMKDIPGYLDITPADFKEIYLKAYQKAVLRRAGKSPLAQPRNVLGGHLLSAMIGVACWKLLPAFPWLACSLAVSTAIAVMHWTKTLHPPAGATALIAVIGGEKIHSLGFMYALVPVGAGVTIMLLIAVLFNNIPRARRYPEFWL